MSNQEDIPYVDAELCEDDVKDGIHKLVMFLNPTWNTDELVIEKNSLGYANKNYHIRHPGSDEAFIIRLVNPKIKFLQDITVKGMKYLKRRGIGAKLLCTFKNGVIMDYLNGETVSWPTFMKVRNPVVWAALARELARYHETTNWQDIKELEIKNFRDLDFAIQPLDELLKSGKIPVEDVEELPTAEELRQHIEKIFGVLDSLNAEIAFCHLDANPTNVLIQGSEVTLLDYDYCYPHYAAFNVAFCFETSFNILDIKFEDMPSETEMKDFVLEYLKTRKAIGGHTEPVTRQDLQRFLWLVRKARLLVMIQIVIGTIMVQDISHQTLDMGMAHMFWKRFLHSQDALKEEFVDIGIELQLN